MELTTIHKKALAYLDNYKSRLSEISQQLFDNPEVAYQETFASQLLAAEVKSSYSIRPIM